MNAIDFEPTRGDVIVTYDAGDEESHEAALMLCQEMERSGIAARLRTNHWWRPNWGVLAGTFVVGVISFAVGWLCGRYQ